MSLFRWLLPLSVGLHVVIVKVIPDHPRTVASSRAPVMIEVMEPPPPTPPPPPPPPPKEPEPTPSTVAPSPTKVAQQPMERPIATMPVGAGAEGGEGAPVLPVAAPVDFTATTISNVATTTKTTEPAALSAKAAPPAPVFVPPSALGRPPRAPGLDVDLERNYPADARRQGISGTATLRVRLQPDGRIGNVERVGESYPGFGDACEKTVRGGRWEPPIDREGHPVGTEIKYVCRFEVRS